MSNFKNAITEDRRLSLLLVLDSTPGYSANAFLLREALEQVYGYRVSVDVVLTDIAWLAEQGLAAARTTGGNVSSVTVATLTARGTDVAHDRARVPGVKVPTP